MMYPDNWWSEQFYHRRFRWKSKCSDIEDAKKIELWILSALSWWLRLDFNLSSALKLTIYSGKSTLWNYLPEINEFYTNNWCWEFHIFLPFHITIDKYAKNRDFLNTFKWLWVTKNTTFSQCLEVVHATESICFYCIAGLSHKFSLNFLISNKFVFRIQK